MVSKFFLKSFSGNAATISKRNGIEYIPKVKLKKYTPDDQLVNRFYADKGAYILLHPANDGMPTCPFEWYGKFNGKTKKIIDNQSSFKEITNLADIIIDMIRLYTKYINTDVVIADSGFAIKLTDEVSADYVGEASLVLTDGAILNAKLKPEKVLEAKKYYINNFLDHFIGWNFGVVVKNNPKLEEELIRFNELVIIKGFRKRAGSGFEVWCSEDVQHYRLKYA